MYYFELLNIIHLYASVEGFIGRLPETRKDTRIKFYETVAVPIFLYANETWSLSKRDVQRIQAAEMKFLNHFDTIDNSITFQKQN